MNILVTGANGQLGNEMRIVASRPSSMSHNFVFTDVSGQEGEPTLPLDITDSEAVMNMVRERQIDCIVNCAAYTNVDAAESNPMIAEMLNADAPGNLARAMKEVGGLLVHISTDYVFGEEPYNTPCTESRKGTPTGVYGRTKLQGEQNVKSIGCDYAIVRTAWLYSEFGKNFVKTMLELTSTRPQIKVVFDQVGTPTYALDLAEAIMLMIESYAAGSCPRKGVYHFSNEGVCSWYDFARMIAEYSGHTGCDIKPCHSDEFPSPVRRPSYSVLDKTLIKQTFGLNIPYWTDSLKKCLNNMNHFII